MAHLVHELQKQALSEGGNITDLLRKALFVAKKLKVSELEEWVSHELNGYPDGVDTPEYRVMKGSVKVFNPFHGWQPVMFESSKESYWLTNRNTLQPASEIQYMLDNHTEGGMASMPFSPEIAKQIMNSIGHDLQPTLQVPLSQLSRIMDGIKNVILNWAMKLEEDGILGDEFSFSPVEIQKAAQASYNITNIAGNVVGSQLQQGAEGSNQTKGGE